MRFFLRCRVSPRFLVALLIIVEMALLHNDLMSSMLGGLGVVEFLELVEWVCVLVGVGGVCVVVCVCLVPVDGLSS